MAAKKDRDLDDVIGKILKSIPQYEFEDMNAALQRVQKDIGFTPPELMHVRWNEVHDVLSDYIGFHPRSDWQIKIWSIFTGLTIDEIKAKIK